MFYLLFLFTNDFQWFSTTGGVSEHRGDQAKRQPFCTFMLHWKIIHNYLQLNWIGFLNEVHTLQHGSPTATVPRINSQ